MAVAAGVVLLVAVVVIAFIALRPGSNPNPVPTPTGQTAQSILAEITSLPTSELDQVGGGSANIQKFGAISGQPLSSNGKPEVLFVGAEYCPYCAAERWALIIAFSRFGQLSGVDLTTSSSSDAFPDTPTFTFRHATYSSDSLALRTVELGDRLGNALQQATPAETALDQQYASGTIPFVDLGGRLYFYGATYIPDDLQGLDWQSIANDLRNPSTSQAKEILGSANYITAAICRAIGGPPSVCSDPVIQRLEAALPKS